MRDYRTRNDTRQLVYAALEEMGIGEERQFRITQRFDAQRAVYHMNRKKVRGFITKASTDNVSIWRVK